MCESVSFSGQLTHSDYYTKQMSTQDAKDPHVDLKKLGAEIRARRKVLRVNSTAASESAGISRVTLHRIEKGEPTVAIGAWARVLESLGMSLDVQLQKSSISEVPPRPTGWIPAMIPIADYPELRSLAWQVQGTDMLRPKEAFDIYQRNQRHMQTDRMQASEIDLVQALRLAFGEPSDV
ncbi:MAG: hypothetical protein J0L65_14725 [Xanthomonadales bacterium]|nr:hypothetical protein [Xanthomonadales bacterium]